MPKLIQPAFVVAFLLGVSCDNKFEKECNLDDLVACSPTQIPDSIAVVNALTGKWKWEYQLSCAGSTTDDPSDDQVYEGMIVEFFEGGRGEYTRGNTSGDFDWQLDRVSSGKNYFEMRDPDRPLFPPHNAIDGVIYICDDKLAFSSRGSDGVDNLFRRL